MLHEIADHTQIDLDRLFVKLYVRGHMLWSLNVV